MEVAGDDDGPLEAAGDEGGGGGGCSVAQTQLAIAVLAPAVGVVGGGDPAGMLRPGGDRLHDLAA